MTDKIYPVTKDGVTFEVRAASPEDAAAKAAQVDVSSVARMIARSGTTRVFERPNGQRYVVSPGFSSTDPDAVQKALGGMTAEQVSRAGIDESLIERYPTEARALQFARGMPWLGSRVDEAIGAVAGPEAATATRALSGAMERQRPGETLGLNLAGGVTSAAGVAAAMPQVIAGALGGIAGSGTRATQMARLAGAGGLLGALEGGVYGSGEGTTPEERAANAAQGGLFGGIVGAGAGAATPLLEAGARNVMGLVRRSDVAKIAALFGISPAAARVIKSTFSMGGDITEAIRRVEQAGAEGIVGDAGTAAQALLDATAASGPVGAATVRGALDERMTRVNQNMDTGLTGLLGMPAEGPVTAVNEIMDRTRAARGTAYDDAYNTPIDYASAEGRRIEDIALKRIEPDVLMSAVQQANAEMRDRGLTNMQIKAVIAPDGSVTFVEMPNVRQLDELKKALDNLSRKAKNTEGMVAVDTTESLRYKRQANALRDALIDATGGPSGTYGKAVRLGGDTIGERKAYELGESLLSPTTRVEDVMLELGATPSAAQLEAAKRGLRTRIEQFVGDVRRIPSDPNIDARQALAVLREMGSDNARTKIQRLLGAEANDVFRLLDEATVAAETRAATSINSRTAIRQATDKMVTDITAPGVLGQAQRAEPVNTTKALIQAVTGYTDEFTAQQRQRVYTDLAKALTEKRGPDARAALAALDAAMRGQALTDAQTDMLAKLVTNALMSGAAPTAGRQTGQGFYQ